PRSDRQPGWNGRWSRARRRRLASWAWSSYHGLSASKLNVDGNRALAFMIDLAPAARASVERGPEDAMGRLGDVAGLAGVMSLLPSAGHARAVVLVRVDKSSQRMSVIVNGEHRYTWAVSTGIYGTPSGTFRPQSLARYHRSTLYNNAPMPYSIFYDGNFAIH